MRRKLKHVIKSDIIKNDVDIEFKTEQKIKAKNHRHGNIKTKIQKEKNLVFQKIARKSRIM